jgi:putative PEP-CTERM system TPR-repeat lipoprotein
MTKNPIAMAVALALTTSLSLSGCDRTSSLTEQEHIQRAKDLDDKGKLKESVIELKNAIQKNPDSAQARLLLGEIYLRLGLGNEAEKELSRAEKLGVNPETIKLQLGKAWLLTGEYKRVIEEISPTLSTSPRSKAAFINMQGDALIGLRKRDEGCKLYEDALAIDSNHVPAYLGLANCALSRNKIDEARDQLAAAIKINPSDPGTWVALGNFERLNNNSQAAIAAYSTALKHDPSNLDALFGRVQIYAESGKSAEAKADLKRLKELAPTFFGIHFAEALLNYSAGKTDQALEAVQRSIKANPNHMPSQLLFAIVQYDKKSYGNAAKTLGQYLQRIPGHLEVRKLLAATYLKLNQPGRTLELLAPYIAAGKADGQILALAGEARIRSDDPASANDLFVKASELVPTSVAFRTKAGLSLLASGDNAEAISALDATAAMSGKDPRADIALAYHYIDTKQYDHALAVLADIEKKIPDSPGTHSLRGVVYAGKGDYVQARKSYERALALKPDLVSASIRLAAIDIKEKQYAAARSRYQSILDKDGKNIPAMVGLAELSAIENKQDEYLSWLEKALKANPAAFVPRALMANHYLETQQPQKALVMAREAVTGNPGLPDALALLGRVQLAAGDLDSAVSTFTKLANLSPKSAEAQYNLAKALASKGNEEGARSALRTALTLDSEHVDALAALSSLEAARGNHAEAVKLARSVQALATVSPRGFVLEGDALLAQKRYAEAASAYGRAPEKSKDTQLTIQQHRALLLGSSTDKADSLLLGWLQAHPQDLVARAYLAESYIRRKLNAEAIKQYEILLATVPNNPMMLNNLAILYQQQQNPKALPTAEKTYKIAPDTPAYADTLGWILVQQGQTERGLKLLEKAVAGSPKNPEVRFHLAYALTQAGRKPQAQQEIKRLQAMQLNPELAQQVTRLKQRLP